MYMTIQDNDKARFPSSSLLDKSNNYLLTTIQATMAYLQGDTNTYMWREGSPAILFRLEQTFTPIDQYKSCVIINLWLNVIH
jgi:hypothetical protein